MTWEIGSRMIRLFLSPKRYHLSSPFTPTAASATVRSEEHTSELQSPCNLVCRLLLEKKKQSHAYEVPRRTRRHSAPRLYQAVPDGEFSARESALRIAQLYHSAGSPAHRRRWSSHSCG